MSPTLACNFIGSFDFGIHQENCKVGFKCTLIEKASLWHDKKGALNNQSTHGGKWKKEIAGRIKQNFALYSFASNHRQKLIYYVSKNMKKQEIYYLHLYTIQYSLTFGKMSLFMIITPDLSKNLHPPKCKNENEVQYTCKSSSSPNENSGTSISPFTVFFSCLIVHSPNIIVIISKYIDKRKESHNKYNSN